MKRLSILFACSAALLCGAELAGVRAVYVMPMSHGVDQFLANRLTGSGLFQVVADPKLADTIFTDRIGDAFQAALEKISPTPKPPVEAKDADAKADKGGKAGTDDKKAKSDEERGNPALNSTFGRGKGTFFLVNAKSRAVLWSTFEPSTGSSARELDRTASAIVGQLKRDMGKK
ncbi:MAG: hypothetical protein ABSF25_12430 [Bryobacteraceae bacterium]